MLKKSRELVSGRGGRLMLLGVGNIKLQMLMFGKCKRGKFPSNPVVFAAVL